MLFKKAVVKFLAKQNKKKVDRWSKNSLLNQKKIFQKHMKILPKTTFGKSIGAKKNMTIDNFREVCPINSYENISGFIERIANGEKNVLWPGKLLYFAKTSGTTSGTKYIPLTKEMLRHQINASKEALLLYAHNNNKYDHINGKMMFVQGSPVLKKHKKIYTGRLSGIVAHHIPYFLKSNRLPSMKTNSIKVWGEKLDKIVEETIGADLRLIGGIPPWVIMYFQKIFKKTNQKSHLKIFPNLSLYVHGGVSFQPYKNTLEGLLPGVDFLEYYPASEGFIGYQDNIKKNELLLLTNHGIFYEFIRAVDFISGNNTRITLDEVVLGENYVLILSTCSGLWSYNIGDTVRFVNLSPYRIVVTGRVNHFISAFGEHVIGKEVDSALDSGLKKFGGKVFGFTVCPNIRPKKGLPHHEWFIEFIEKPENISGFCDHLDGCMRKQNIYYSDLIKSLVIQPLVVNCVKVGSFNNYMSSIGKLGGQNKCPSLSNDRRIGDYLKNYIE